MITEVIYVRFIIFLNHFRSLSSDPSDLSWLATGKAKDDHVIQTLGILKLSDPRVKLQTRQVEQIYKAREDGKVNDLYDLLRVLYIWLFRKSNLTMFDAY